MSQEALVVSIIITIDHHKQIDVQKTNLTKTVLPHNAQSIHCVPLHSRYLFQQLQFNFRI